MATDLADQFRDGASFVDLSNAHDTNAVLVAVARAIGLGEIIDRPLQDELVDRLRDRRMLLVLDNLEQVTEAAAAVAQLLSDCPGLTVLATSREPLHVRAEQLFPVLPLALPPEDHGRVTAAAIRDVAAVRLFVDRAHVVRPEFEVTDDNAAAVAEICRRLDGLPLAIELAAARLRLFSPEVLRDRLDDRLGLLRSGPRDLPERQQTLRAAMDWSYELLSPGEQRLFEMLAAFASAEVTAIEAVIDDAGAADDGDLDVLDGLAGLVEKSLLRRVDTPGRRAARRDAPDDPRVRGRPPRPATRRRVASPAGPRPLLRGPGAPPPRGPDDRRARGGPGSPPCRCREPADRVDLLGRRRATSSTWTGSRRRCSRSTTPTAGTSTPRTWRPTCWPC